MAGVSAAEIDRSARWPLLFLFAKSAAWLVAGCGLALIASVKLVTPEFLNASAWTTYGRVQPAALNALIHGFASQAAFGAGLWLLARLGRARLQCPALVVAGGMLWNVGVFLGVMGIMGGDGTGYPFFEMPRYAAYLLAVAILLFAVAGLQTFRARVEKNLYPSHWHVVAAVFWFFWVYCTAVGLLLCAPQRGVMQVVVNTWFANNLFYLWLTPMGLACAYYLIPKLTGQPLHSAPLAKMAFWMIAVFGAGCGFHYALPLPRWLPAVSNVCDLMMIVAVLAVALNFHQTLRGDYRPLGRQPALLLAASGILAWIVAVALQMVLSRPGIRDTLQLTWAAQARNCLLIFGFSLPVLLAALVHIIPALCEREWPCAILPKVMVAGVAGGAVVMIGSLLWAGHLQGGLINDPRVPFADSQAAIRNCLLAAAVGMALITAGAAAFAGNVLLLAKGWCQAVCGCCRGRAEKLEPAEVAP